MNSLQRLSNLIGGTIMGSPLSGTTVEALSWDITLGVAGTGIGQKILSATSSSGEMVPEGIDHVGLIVYGHLYEFGDLGILRSLVPLDGQVKSKYPGFWLSSREAMGETKKTHEEFEAWIEEQKEGLFQASNYDLVSRSCVVWAIHACEFLEVPHPENWDKLCDWAEENKTVAGWVGASGVNSRKVQLKAPGKIKNYVKNKFRHKKDSKIEESESDEAANATHKEDQDEEDENEVEDTKM